MKKRLLSLLVVALALVAISFGVMSVRAQAAAKPVDFSLKDVDGKTVQLSDYRGKVVIIDVWATWCGYCVKEIPDLVALQAKATKNKTPLQIIGVSMDDNKGAVKTFSAKKDINYPILYGTENALKPLGDVYGLPTKFIISKDGVVVEKIVGARSAAELERTVQKYLK